MNENLYETVKDRICDDIFKGVYEDGDKLPPERELEETLGVSRVTIRKSLEILEQDGLIVREVGRGTRLTLQNTGHMDELDMIVLIAPARNPFFSEFIARFQLYAHQKDTLVLYVEKPQTESLEKCLYHLYKKGLRNAVVWLEDLKVEDEKLRRLRALGMNMVFFDSNQGLPYADCVAVDNKKAIQRLYETLKKEGYKSIGYLSWNRNDIYSIKEREDAFRSCDDKKNDCLTLAWKQKVKADALREEIKAKKWDAIICSDRDCGEIAVRVLKKEMPKIRIATVDTLPENEKKGVLMYQQNLEKSVEQIVSCLQEQCQKPEKWTPKMYQIQGKIQAD